MDAKSKATIHMYFWRIHSKAPTMKNIFTKIAGPSLQFY